MISYSFFIKMVTYDEYLEYFENFKKDIRLRKMNIFIHYLIDSVIIEDLSGPSYCTNLTLNSSTRLIGDREPYVSYGNMIISRGKHKRPSCEFHLKSSNHWYHALPNVDLHTLRYSTIKRNSEENAEYILLFKRIYDDYRMRTEIFHIYDLEIKYLSFANCQ